MAGATSGGAWIAAGASYCAIAIIAGAFGAHGLKARLDTDALALWETAARYLIYAGFGIVLVGLAAHGVGRRGFDVAAWLLLVGGAIFSSTVAALALGGPRVLGAVTPIGGTLLIAGFVVFGITALRA